MQKEDFEKLKYFILDKNSCFDAGFANVYKDETNRIVCKPTENDLSVVFPADNIGNYFYLRNESSIKHEAKPDERLTDGGTQKLSFLDTTTVYLVAIVNHADPYILLQNLINTVMQYRDLNVQPQISNWNRELVVIEELQKVKVEDLQAILKRLKDETIVKLTLTVSKLFVPSDCIVNSINS